MQAYLTIVLMFYDLVRGEVFRENVLYEEREHYLS
jgi:hypothetical protein